MSGVQLLAPLGLAGLVGIPLVIFFHMRHTTPIERSTPTLRFWRMVTPLPTDETRLRWPPLSLLLILQLLAVGALGLALARPAIADAWAGLTESAAPRHLVILLDGSTSMAATDGEPGQERFEAAKMVALQRIGELHDGDAATVLVLGSSVQSFAAGNSAEMHALNEQLAALPLPGGRADLNSALSLASNLLLPSMNDQVVVITDGAVAADPAVVALVEAPIELLRIGRANAPNLAIVQLTAGAPGANLSETALFARLANFSGSNVDTTVSLLADGIVIQTDPVSIPAGGTVDFTSVALPAGISRARLELRATDDALALDNSAELILAGQNDLAQRILLVSDTPLIVQRVLSALPGADVTTISTTDYLESTLTDGPYDVLVFENFTPAMPSALTAPALFIHPPVDGLLPATGVMTTSKVHHLRPGDPLLQGVDLTGLTFREAPIRALAPDDTEIVGGERGPLIYRGTAPGSAEPMVVIAFGLQDNILPQRIAFPILMTNIMRSLAPAALPASATLGDPLTLQPRAGVQTIRITSPTGIVSEIPVTTSTSGQPDPVIYAETGAAGEYALEELAAPGEVIATGAFVIDAGHPTESNLSANPDLPATLATAEADPENRPDQERLGDLWPILAAGALGLLALEWFLMVTGAGTRRYFRLPKRARI